MPIGPSATSMGVSTSLDTNGTWDVRYRPLADDPPRNGEGDHRRWWRGTGGVALRIKDRKHLTCPSTMLRMVPLPRWGRNDSSPPQSGPRVTIGSRRTIMVAEERLTKHRNNSISISCGSQTIHTKDGKKRSHKA